MRRNLVSEALIIRNYRIGEIHKGVVALTPIHGVIHAVAHGAYRPRSRLSGSAGIFQAVLLYLYYEPVKKNYKITDIQTRRTFDGVRTSIRKYYAASLWGEVALKTYGGGDDFRGTYDLLVESLGTLDTQPEERVEEVTLQFLHRYMSLTGFMPSLHECGRCGREIGTEESLYGMTGDFFVCESCSSNRDYVVTAGARRYLEYTSRLSIGAALSARPDDGSLSGLRRSLLYLVQHVVEQPLNTLTSGKGLV